MHIYDNTNSKHDNRVLGDTMNKKYIFILTLILTIGIANAAVLDQKSEQYAQTATNLNTSFTINSGNKLLIVA